MLANGAHVRINGVDYLIDESQEGHYNYELRPLLVPRLDITGAPGKQQLNPEKLLWTFDDWSGGEGNNVYYPDQPTRYFVSNGINTRIPGRATGVLSRTTMTITAHDKREAMRVGFGSGAMWVAGAGTSASTPALLVAYTRNGTSFTTLSQAESGFTATDGVADIPTAIAGDLQYVYIASQGAAGGLSQTEVRRLELWPSGTVTSSDVLTVTAAPRVGLAVFQGHLWVWTVQRLERWAVGTLPVPSADRVTMHDTGFDWGSSANWELDSTVFGDMIVADNRLVYYGSLMSVSTIWQMLDGIPSQLFAAPEGFQIRGICFQSGVIWVAGQWGDATNPGVAGLWAIPLDSSRAFYVTDIRAANEQYLTISNVSSGPRGTILITATTGQVFVYDPIADGLSLLDEGYLSTDYTAYDVVTFGKHRYVITDYTGGTASGNHEIFRWADDHVLANRRANVTGKYVESGDWDFGFPQELKLLNGFHVNFEPMVSNQRIDIHYSKDAGATWTNLTDVTSATSGNADGRVYIPVSVAGSTVKFQKLRFRVYLESTAGGVLPPILYSVTAEAKLAARRRSWQLALRIADETTGTRITSGQRSAEQQRDNLRTAADSLDVVEFVDGYPYGDKVDSDTYNVTIETFSEVVDINGQGTAIVELLEAPS